MPNKGAEKSLIQSQGKKELTTTTTVTVVTIIVAAVLGVDGKGDQGKKEQQGVSGQQ